MDTIMREIGVILAAIVGLAIIAVLVSRNAQTPQVLQSFFGGFAQSIGAAVAPVSGGGFGGYGFGGSAF